MTSNVSIQPHKIKNASNLYIDFIPSLIGFPLITIDRDSYISSAQVQSGINFDIEGGRHCISIGKHCALADAITFMIDLNHNYNSVIQGEASFLQGISIENNTLRKGTIILQNDVWIGHGATIMPGVILHNGCIVATDAVVTKDVPPYAIVAGNPAKIIRYRFDDTIISGLQKIAWWDWSYETLLERKDDFTLSPDLFVEKYLPEAEEREKSLLFLPTDDKQRKIIVFFPDFEDNFPLYPKVLQQFCKLEREDIELLIYVSENDSTPENLSSLESILQKYEDHNCYITLQTAVDIPDAVLINHADYYITTRSLSTVYHTCLCDRYNTKILYSTNDPIFPDHL